MKAFRSLMVLILIGFTSHPLFSQVSGTFVIGPKPSHFQTIQSAIDALAANTVSGKVVFNIKPGDYKEQLLVPYFWGASLSFPVVFQSESGINTDVVIHFKPTADSANYTLRLEGTEYVQFKNLTISTDTISARLVEINGNCQYNLFRNVRFAGMVNGGPLIFSPCNSQYAPDNFNMFFRNYFFNGSYGFHYCGNSTPYETNTMIDSNYFYNQSEGAIWLGQEFGSTIRNNYIFTNTQNSDYYGIYIEKSSGPFKIQNNILNLLDLKGLPYALRTYQLASDMGQETVISNNMIHANTSDWVCAINLVMSENIQLLFNSINITGNSSGSVCFNQLSGTGILLKNNIFSNKAEGLCILADNYLASDYNDLYSSGISIAFKNNTFFDSLSQWRTATGLDLNSVNFDPEFCSDSNLHTFNQNLDGKAQYLSAFKKDQEGETRSTTKPDIGADEFTPFSFTIGNDTSICSGQTIVFKPNKTFTTYLWNDGKKSASDTISIVTDQTNKFPLKLNAWLKGCLFSDSLTLTVKRNPTPVLPPDTQLCHNFNESLLLHAGQGYDKYHWYNGDTTESFLANNTTALPETTKTYWVKVDSAGCSGADTLKIYWRVCDGVVDNLIPHFTIERISDYQLRIFYPDQAIDWGEISVFELSGKLISHSKTAFPGIIDIPSTGIYIIKLTTKESVITQKFLF